MHVYREKKRIEKKQTPFDWFLFFFWQKIALQWRERVQQKEKREKNKSKTYRQWDATQKSEQILTFFLKRMAKAKKKNQDQQFQFSGFKKKTFLFLTHFDICFTKKNVSQTKEKKREWIRNFQRKQPKKKKVDKSKHLLFLSKLRIFWIFWAKKKRD